MQQSVVAPNVDEARAQQALDRIGRWTLVELPRLNRAILAGRQPPAAAAEPIRVALADLPDPETFSPQQARRLVVDLSFCGASVARHYQEQDPARRATPQRAFDQLPVGPARLGFREYFARAAARTGTGHPPRDSAVSLIRWNVPTTEVWWDGQRLAALAGAAGDGRVRTYTGDPGEKRFFELAKKTETIEAAVNGQLEPVSDGSIELESADGIGRLQVATSLLTALRRLNEAFAALPAQSLLRSDHFLAVFGQFAVHWEAGDLPPNGALDPEALKRDFLLGIELPHYHRHAQRLFPALLSTERTALRRLMRRPPLPGQLLAHIGYEPAMLARLSPATVRALVRQHPALAACYLLLTANARACGLQLMLAKRFLVRPAPTAAPDGRADPRPESDQPDVPGLDRHLLVRLVRARRDHSLACLRQFPPGELVELAGLPRPRVLPDTGLPALVRTVGPGAGRRAGL